MRSSVLFWYWHISWRATIPSQYLLGHLSPPWKNTLWVAFATTVGLIQQASVLTNIWVRRILATSMQPPAPPGASSTCPTHLAREVYFWRLPSVGVPSSGLPLVLLSFFPSEMEQGSVRDHSGLFKVACSPFILMLMASLFWIEALILEMTEK